MDPDPITDKKHGTMGSSVSIFSWVSVKLEISSAWSVLTSSCWNADATGVADVVSLNAVSTTTPSCEE